MVQASDKWQRSNNIRAVRSTIAAAALQHGPAAEGALAGGPCSIGKRLFRQMHDRGARHCTIR